MSGLSDSGYWVRGDAYVGYRVAFTIGGTLFSYRLTHAQYLRFLGKRSNQERYQLLTMWKLRGELS